MASGASNSGNSREVTKFPEGTGPGGGGEDHFILGLPQFHLLDLVLYGPRLKSSLC